MKRSEERTSWASVCGYAPCILCPSIRGLHHQCEKELCGSRDMRPFPDHFLPTHLFSYIFRQIRSKLPKNQPEPIWKSLFLWKYQVGFGWFVGKTWMELRLLSWLLCILHGKKEMATWICSTRTFKLQMSLLFLSSFWSGTRRSSLRAHDPPIPTKYSSHYIMRASLQHTFFRGKMRVLHQMSYVKAPRIPKNTFRQDICRE